MVERNVTPLLHCGKIESRVKGPPHMSMCLGIRLHDQRTLGPGRCIELPGLLKLHLGSWLISVVDVA